MLKIITTEKIDEKSFIMHFGDFEGNTLTDKRDKMIDTYSTDDGSECDLSLKINSVAKLISIDITIKYPENSISSPEELEERIKTNEKRFAEFYNEIMGY